jgi:TatA/E family protein of Tat protein translocase
MDLGLPELLVIVVVLLLLFGPTKIPQLGGSLGRAIRNFREAASGRSDRPEARRDEEAASAPALPEGQARQTTGSPPEAARPADSVAPGAGRNGSR